MKPATEIVFVFAFFYATTKLVMCFFHLRTCLFNKLMRGFRCNGMNACNLAMCSSSPNGFYCCFIGQYFTATSDAQCYTLGHNKQNVYQCLLTTMMPRGSSKRAQHRTPFGGNNNRI